MFTLNLKVTHSIHRRKSYLCDYSTIKFIEVLDCDNARNFQEIADLKKSTSEIPTNRDSNRSHMTGNIHPMNVHTERFTKFAHLRSQPAKNHKKAQFRRFLRPWRHRTLRGTSEKISKQFGNMVRTSENHITCFGLINWSFVHRYRYSRGSNSDQKWPKYRIKQKCPKIPSQPDYDINNRYRTLTMRFSD